MKLDEKKLEKFKQAFDICKDIEYIVNDSIGEEVCIVGSDEGSEENASSLIFLDVMSFTTLSTLPKAAFMEALSLCDAVNFFNADDYVRITLGFNNTHIKELETQIKQFKK